jgi:hypothetical protein
MSVKGGRERMREVSTLGRADHVTCGKTVL